MNFKGFTLIELLITVIIMGIVASIAVPSYINTKEKAMDREAISMLKLIQIAQKMYYSKNERYYNGTTVANINGNLSLDLNFNTWNYSANNISGGGSTAARKGRTWLINRTDANARCTPTSACF